MAGAAAETTRVPRLLSRLSGPTLAATAGSTANALTVGARTEYGGVLFVNCGSVGKPKDGDPRASFAVVEAAEDGVSVSIERAAYNALAVAREMRAVGLPDELADKLVAAA